MAEKTLNLVVLPAYNEQHALPATIQRLQSLPGNFELLVINARLRAAISERRPSHELLQYASAGHHSMRHDGLTKAAAGFTTIDQVLRSTQDADTNGASG